MQPKSAFSLSRATSHPVPHNPSLTLSVCDRGRSPLISLIERFG
jgi:hypothetical protein